MHIRDKYFKKFSEAFSKMPKSTLWNQSTLPKSKLKWFISDQLGNTRR